MNSVATKFSDIKRNWHIVDVKGKVLGRISTEIATMLIGKKKPYYVPNLDCGDHVIVVNAKEVVTTGKKDLQKRYYRHSGYPGGMHSQSLATLREDHPERVIEHAVKGMLPQNKLRDRMLRRLHVYVGSEHPYEDKIRSTKS